MAHKARLVREVEAYLQGHRVKGWFMYLHLAIIAILTVSAASAAAQSPPQVSPSKKSDFNLQNSDKAATSDLQDGRVGHKDVKVWPRKPKNPPATQSELMPKRSFGSEECDAVKRLKGEC